MLDEDLWSLQLHPDPDWMDRVPELDHATGSGDENIDDIGHMQSGEAEGGGQVTPRELDVALRYLCLAHRLTVV